METKKEKVTDVNETAVNFMENWLKYLKSAEISTANILSANFGKKPCQIYLLYQLVKDFGGFDHVNESKLWPSVSNKLGLRSNVLTMNVRNFYERYLLSYALNEESEKEKINVEKDKDEKDSPLVEKNPNKVPLSLSPPTSLKRDVNAEETFKKQCASVTSKNEEASLKENDEVSSELSSTDSSFEESFSFDLADGVANQIFTSTPFLAQSMFNVAATTAAQQLQTTTNAFSSSTIFLGAPLFPVLPYPNFFPPTFQSFGFPTFSPIICPAQNLKYPVRNAENLVGNVPKKRKLSNVVEIVEEIED